MPSRTRRRLWPSRARGPSVLLLALLMLVGFAVPASAAAPSSFTVGVTPGVGGAGVAPVVDFPLADGDTAVCTIAGVAVDPCAPGTALPEPAADGRHAVAVTVTRADVTTTDPVSGEPVTVTGGSTSAGTTYVRDTAAPVVAVTSPSGLYADSTGWTVTVTDLTDTSLSCRLGEVVDGATVDRGGVACAPGAVQPALPADGTYVLTATARDALEQQRSVTSAPYAHDTTAPVVTVVPVNQPARDSKTSMRFDFTVSDSTASVRCSLAGPAAPATSACDPTGSYTASGLSADGEYVLTVSAKDPAGNVGSATGRYVLDTTGPVITLSPAGTTTGTSPGTTWTVGLGDAVPGSEKCTLDGLSVPCTSTVASTPLPVDGSSTLVVLAEDDLKNRTTTSATYVRETTPARPTVTVDPVSPGTDATPAWTTVVGEAETVACTLTAPDGSRTAPLCATPGATTTWTPPTALGDGRWTLSVVASTTSGGPSPAGSASYVVDTSEPPAPQLVAAHTGTSGNASPLAWSWTAEAGRTTQCQRTVDGVTGEWLPCTSPQSITPTPDDTGLYGLSLRYVDGLLNTGTPSSATYAYDGQAPAAPSVTSRTTGPVQPGPATWDLAAAPDSGTTALLCRLTGDTGAAVCTSPLTRTLAEGTWTLTVQARDAAGNLSTAVTSTVVVDGTAPQPPVVTGDGSDPADVRSTRTELTWTVAAADTDTADIACRLVTDGVPAPVYSACSPTWTVTASGRYALQAVARDAAGNLSPSTTGPTYEVDITGPLAPAVTVDDAADNETTATWRITAAEPGAVECRLQRSSATSGTVLQHDWTSCATPYSPVLTEGEGTYLLSARTYDDLGNRGTPSAAVAYELDLTPPAPAGTPALDPARATGNLAQVVWRWTGTAPGAECTLLSGSLPAPATTVLASCTSGQQVVLPGEGEHRLQVVLLDEHGNRSGAATSAPYLLDQTDPDEPVVTVDGGRDGTTDDVRGVGYSFSGDGTATCRLYRDGLVAADPDVGCTAPYGVLLPDVSGAYRLGVTYEDAAGNTSTEGLSGTYTLDVDAPLDPIVTVDPDTDDVASATWTVLARETGTTSECRLHHDGSPVREPWTRCAAPYAFSLDAGDGSYRLEVRLTDAVGNLGNAVLGEAYVLDTSAPGQPVVAGLDLPSQDRDVTWSWTWSGAAAGDTAACRVLRGGTDVTADVSGLTCTSGTAVTLPAVTGSYQLEVVVTDAVGNASAPGLSPAYPLDVTAPTPVVASTAAASPSRERSVVWTFAAEGTTACRAAVRGGTDAAPTWTALSALAPCTSPHTTLLPSTSGAYALEVVDTDAVGNASALGRSLPYLLDVTPPAVPAPTGPTGTGNVRTVTWSFPGEGTATCQLLLGGSPSGAVVPSCGPTFTTTLTGDGGWQLEVVRTDAVGNASAPGRSTVYLLDTAPPAAPTVSAPSPAGPAPSRSPAWTVSGEASTRLECRLVRGTNEVVGWSACPTGFTADLTGQPDGAYLLTARATDAAGNTSPTGSAPSSYVLDTTAPGAPVVSGPSGPSPTRTPRFTWTGEAGTAASCTLALGGVPAGAPVACTSGHTPTLTTDGSWTLTVVLTDVAGNVGAPGTSGAYELDTVAPAVPVVTAPVSPSQSRTPGWAVNAEPGARLDCRLTPPSGVAPAWTTCPAPLVTPLAGQPDGTYRLEVRATDAAGNTSVPGSARYVLDTTAPQPPLVAGPAPTGPSPDRRPTWTFTAEAGARVDCQVLRGTAVVLGWLPCSGSSTADLTGQPDGGYALQVRATDAAGNVSASTTGAVYVLDTTAPAAPVVTGPAGPSSLRTPRFTWTGEAGTTAACSLAVGGQTSGGPVPCRSGYSPALPTDGSWTLSVVLSDAAGNAGPAGTSDPYLLDTTAPATPTVTAPASPGRDQAPVWGVVAEGGAALECRLTAVSGTPGGWAVCPSPLTTALAGQPDGRYALEVRATDAAGNVSATGRAVYELDTQAPTAPVLSGPTGPARGLLPVYSFPVEPGATAECRATSGATLISEFAPCASPAPLDLAGRADGSYVLTVRVTDAAGNPGPASTATYVLDTTPPAAPVFTTLPASPDSARTATWVFTAESGTTTRCSLTAPGGAVRVLSPCASPLAVDLTGLSDGSYGLSVVAVDVAGNASAVTTVAHVLDSTALRAPVITPPVSPGADRTPVWTVDGAPGTECRVTSGAQVLEDWAPCRDTADADLFGRPDGLYVLSARTRTTTETSATATSGYLLDTTAPPAPVLTPPPSPSTNRLPTWTVASAEAGATAECRVLLFGAVHEDWRPCAVSAAGAPLVLDLTGQGDGTYVLEVRLTDAAGNRGPVAAAGYELDTSAPAAVGVQGPPSPGNDPRPVWLISSAPGTLLQCRLTTGDRVLTTPDWVPCDSRFPADLTLEPDGTYVLSVRAVTAAGTPGPETASPYELRRVAPAPPLLTSPAELGGSSRTATWTFTLEPGLTARCEVTRSGTTVEAGPCTSPYTLDLAGAPNGTYLVEFVAVDDADNVSSPTPGRYVLDTVPTDPPVIVAEPGSPASDLEPTWHFTVAADADAECRLLRGPVVVRDWAACESPFAPSLAGQPDGTYAAQVRAVDGSENVSASTSSTYVLDRSAPPSIPFTEVPPTPAQLDAAVWRFAVPDGAAAECLKTSADGRSSPWSPCTSSVTHSFTSTSPDGTYRVQVRAVLPSGARGAASTGLHVRDTTAPPAVVLRAGQAASGAVPAVSWSWTGLEDGAAAQCRLLPPGDVAAFVPCPGGTWDDVLTSDGEHVFQVRAVDAAGNAGPVEEGSYLFDGTRPGTAVYTSEPPRTGVDRTVTWTFEVPEGTTALCSIARNAVSLVALEPCDEGSWTLDATDLPDGTYVLTVVLVDAVGNRSEASPSSYVLGSAATGGGSGTPPSGGGGGEPSRPLPPPSAGSPSGGGPVRGVLPVALQPTGGLLPPSVDDVLGGQDAPSSFPGGGNPVVAAPEGTPARPGGSTALGPLPVSDVPEVIRDVVTGTITKPTLPLALLAVVVLFLLAQNRIDRRDPKLAAGDVPEPELDFTSFVRRPGAAT